MGTYTVISDASCSLLEVLRKTVSPEPISKPETIGLCQPNDRGGNILGIYLYDVKENETMRSQERLRLDAEHYKEPPLSFYLNYMIFVHSSSEAATRMIDEQRILGRVIQQLNNYRRIPGRYMAGSLKDSNEPLEIQPLTLTIDERVKIWSLFNQPYRTSCFYQIGPVYMDTEMIKTTKRVVSAEFDIRQK